MIRPGLDAPLLRSRSVQCRVLSPADSLEIEAASRMDREVWGALGQDAEAFAARVQNGFVIGAFRGPDLLGTISILRRRFAPVYEAASTPGHPYSTWNGITGFGRFDAAEPDGDALFCVAVTSGSARPMADPPVPEGDSPVLALARAIRAREDTRDPDVAAAVRRLARAVESLYIPQDAVMRFHARPKGGGLLGGARIVAVLPNGRPEDLAALGYNVILAYPAIADSFPDPVVLPHDASTGEALVLAAAALAARLGVRVAAPYSRPAGFRRALIEALVAAASTASEATPMVEAVRKTIAEISV